MTNKFSKLEEDLDKLLLEGEAVKMGIAKDLGILDEKTSKELNYIKITKVKELYQKWYSLSMQVIKQILPDRLDDFILQYKNEKRKEITYSTYTISDYLLDLRRSSGKVTIVDKSAVWPKLEIQFGILKSAKKRFKNSLFDIAEVLQADLFDTELDSAKELNKRGFVRAAGAIGGVVLEKHLNKICKYHNLQWKKKNPTINDYNQLLKDNDSIDTSQWRFIQHLGDIRNLCDHLKDREPTKDEVNDFIVGIEKVIKTVY